MTMREGDIWELFIPPELGYGARGAGAKIPPHAVLIFKLELIKVDPPRESWQARIQAFLQKKQSVFGFEMHTWQIFSIMLPMLLNLISALGLFQSGESVTGRHILVDGPGAEKRIKELLGRLQRAGKKGGAKKKEDEDDDDDDMEMKEGEDLFSALARKYSKCPSGKNGGSLGTFRKGQMVPAFDKVCFDPKTPIGRPVAVETSFGWHLVMVDAREGVEEDGGGAEQKKDK